MATLIQNAAFYVESLCGNCYTYNAKMCPEDSKLTKLQIHLLAKKLGQVRTANTTSIDITNKMICKAHCQYPAN